MNRQLLMLCTFVPLMMAGCEVTKDQGMVGTLERDRIEITAETSEPIASRHVRDGQPVRAGDLLIQQDPARIQAQRDQVAAQRDQAAARLAELRRGPRAEAIRETRARLDAARAQAINAQSELNRVQGVFERGLSSRAALDQADAQWKTAQADERAVREALEAQLEGTTVEELEQAEAALAATEAALAQATIELERTRLLAPVDGIVDKLLFQVGERPQPGAAVAVLLDTSRVFARIYVPEHLRAGIRPGQSLKVAVDGVDGVLDGTVRWVSSDASFTPYFALTEHDRSRLSYLAEVDVPDAAQLPSGVPLEVLLPGATD